jgi:ATP-dependent protease ClpP protease subunit
MPEPTGYIKFVGNVDGSTSSALMKAVDDFMSQGMSRIVLLMSSPGGTVFHGLTLYNYLAGLPIEVDTHNFGTVDSIGAAIYVAGKRRYSVPDARFLIHGVSANFPANTALEEGQLAERLAGLRSDTANIASVLARATGKTTDELHDVMLARTVMTPTEAIDFGLAHVIKSDLFPSGARVTSIVKE